MGVQLVEESAYMPIGVLSARHGVSLRTLRFYEQLGLLVPARDGSHRMYTKKDEVKLQVVRIGVKFGFSLAELKRMIEGHISETHSEPETIVPLLNRSLVEERIHRLERRRAEIDAAIEELEASRNGHPTCAPGNINPALETRAVLARAR